MKISIGPGVSACHGQIQVVERGEFESKVARGREVILDEKAAYFDCDIPVEVDGFSLNPAVVNRTVVATPPNSITIIWPD